MAALRLEQTGFSVPSPCWQRRRPPPQDPVSSVPSGHGHSLLAAASVSYDGAQSRRLVLLHPGADANPMEGCICEYRCRGVRQEGCFVGCVVE